MEFKTHYGVSRLVKLNKPKEQELSLQTHHVYSTLKRRGNVRFLVLSTWNTRVCRVIYEVIYFYL